LATEDVVNILDNYATGVAGGESSAGGPSASGTADGDRFSLATFTLRGLSTGPLHRDGFLSANNLGEGFSYDRIEIIRGPQSLLYGANPAGGVINVVTKKAVFGSNFSTPQYQIDSFGTKHAQFDANVSGALAGHQVAVRLSLLDAHYRQWRENLNRRTSGQYGDIAIELIPSYHTILRLSAEEKVNVGVEALPNTTITGAPTLVANGTVLSLLLARHDPALNTIGGLTWNNVDSLGGNAEVSRRIETVYSATLSSDITSWLQAKVVVMKEPVRLDRMSPSGFTGLTAPSTGSNPLNAWAEGYAPGGNTTATRQQGIRGIFTGTFKLGSFTKNDFVLGGEITRSPDGSNFTNGFYAVDANGNFIVNPATASNATGGRTAMPIQWVNVFNNLSGYADFGRSSYTVNGVTYVRDVAKHESAAYVAPGNPLGFNSGVSGATLVLADSSAGYGTLFTTWLGGAVETMLGARYDQVLNYNYSTGVLAEGDGTSANVGVVWNFTKPVALYAGWSSNFSTTTNAAQTIHAVTVPNGRGEGSEAGFKLNAFEGRLSGSIFAYTTQATNQNTGLSTTAISNTDPTGINGHYYTFNVPSIVYDLKTQGVEAEITAQPTPQWRLQFGYNLALGRVGNAVYLPYLYNDQFNTDSTGQVLLADGTPLRVPVSTSTTIAADGKTYAAGVATEVVTANSLKNGDANGNYKAAIDPNSGKITNAAAVGLSIPGVGTGKVGLPIAQHQLGFVPPRPSFLAQYGGDHTLGNPRQTFSLTTVYRLSDGPLRGLSVGFNSRLRLDTVLYYYFDAAGVRRQFLAPDTISFNALAAYQHPLTKHIGFKTQLNVNNVFNSRYLTIYPNATTGAPVDATLRMDPRLWVWTNTLTF
jgi:outer membrane receptor protein involved in Fe transport